MPTATGKFQLNSNFKLNLNDINKDNASTTETTRSLNSYYTGTTSPSHFDLTPFLQKI